MRVQVRCDGCYAEQGNQAGCELPKGWAWMTLDKCWIGTEGVRRRGERYCYASKVFCTDCLLAMRDAYRAVRNRKEATECPPS